MGSQLFELKKIYNAWAHFYIPERADLRVINTLPVNILNLDNKCKIN